VEIEALLRVLLSPVFYGYVLLARLGVFAMRMFATAAASLDAGNAVRDGSAAWADWNNSCVVATSRR
jgi:hypothetical protein